MHTETNQQHNASEPNSANHPHDANQLHGASPRDATAPPLSRGPKSQATQSRGPLAWMRQPLTPRVVTTGSLTSHVHSLAGPPEGGPVYVLLHGIGMSHRYFRRLQLVLARHGDTHSIDLPGFGATPRPAGTHFPQRCRDDVGVVGDAELTVRAVVVGHSMGAQFAAELAVRHPDMVSHVVLLAPVVDSARRSVRQQSLALGLDALRESPVGNAIVLTDYARSGMRWYLTELPVMMSYDLEGSLALVAQPVLVIRGSKDPVASRSWCGKLAATAPDGRYLEIPGKPHIVQHGAAEGTAAAIMALAAR